MTRDRRTILIVEDDDDIREIAAMVLDAEGYQAVGVEDGAAALERLQHGTHPALVLLDLRMPRLGGVEFLQQGREAGLLEGTPVVVLSGEARARDECAPLGLAGFLAKPVEMEDLLATVHRLAPL